MGKWTIGGNAANADVAPEAPRNYYDESLGCPPAGPYLATVKRFHKGETGKNAQNPGEPKIVLLVEIAEPARTKKARYNGYGIWSHQYVIRDDNAGRINQLLMALLGNTNLTQAKKKAVLKAFHSGNVVFDDKTLRITKIGTWVVPEDLEIGISTRKEKNLAGDDALTISSVMPITDMPKRQEVDDADDDEDAEDVEEDEEDEDEEGDEEDEDEAEEDDEEAEEEGFDEEARLAELLELGRAGMRAIAKDLEIRVLKSMDDETLANAIVDAEVAALEAGDEEAEEAEEEDDEEEEPEPEPAKPARRSAAAKPAAKTRAAATRRKGAKASDDDEPPF